MKAFNQSSGIRTNIADTINAMFYAVRVVKGYELKKKADAIKKMQLREGSHGTSEQLFFFFTDTQQFNHVGWAQT